jgi:hypothetical protein
MSILNFPSNPSTGAVYTGTNDVVYSFDGIKWIIQSTSGVMGPSGPSGVQGPAGASGPAGINGTQGVQGLQGLIGAQGVQGAIGGCGAQGLQGSTGGCGVQGVQGIQGTTGANGSNGVQGIQGTTGANGSNGVQGIQGTTGANGSNGVQGIQGTTGANGSNGVQGIQGTTGNNGTAGPTGPSGATGPSGTAGNISITTSTTPPSSPNVGDQWYNSSTDRLFEYTYDGTSYFWLDINGPAYNNPTVTKAANLINPGTFVILDNLKATVTTGGNRGLSLATVSGSASYYIGATYAVSGGNGGSSGTTSLTTTASGSQFNWNFTGAGDISTYILTDTTNSKSYRITLQIGPGYNSSMISIERLI